MSSLSLEWLMNILERCVPWQRYSFGVAALDDLRLADELIDFGEELQAGRR